MKVLGVLNELRPSGMETMLRMSAPLWQRLDVEMEIVSLGGDIGSFAPALSGAGYRVHHLPLLPPRRFLRAFPSLVRAGGYDVVHVHPERANLLVAFVARLAGAKVVRTVHNAFEFEGLLRVERTFQRALLRRLGVVHVAVSPSVAATERRRFANPARCIFNWFDTDRFHAPSPDERAAARAALDLPDRSFVAVSVGNCSGVKNHGAAIEALATLDDIDWCYLHAGIEADDRERRLVAQLAVADRVRFFGQVEDVATLLHAADCFVMPSLWEGLPIAALEALGCGLPSVLARVPGLSDLEPLVPHVWWVSPTPESVASALREVAHLGSASRERVRRETAAAAREHFGPARGVEAYLDVYRALMDGRAVSSRTGWPHPRADRT